MNYAPYLQGGTLGFVGATLAPLRGRSVGDRLNAGGSIAAGQSLVSKDGHFELALQTDGNCVLYNRTNNTAIWQSGTYHGCKGARAILQTDGNFVVYDSANHPCWNAGTNGKGGVSLIVQDDGNLVVYDRQNHAVWATSTQGGVAKKDTGVFATVTRDLNSAIKTVEKIPVLGDAVKITGEVYSAPFKIASNIASGERLDHVALDALKDQLKTIKDAAPYAQTIVSLLPGIGTGVSAAIGAGTALVEGQNITAALKAGVRGALPGGPLAAAAFDTAMKVASGANVAMSALESARGLLPAGPAQTAFDIGISVATGEKIQTALAKGLSNIAGAQLQTILAAGQQAVASTPGLADALKSVTPGAATEGFHLAAGLLAHTGINEKSLAAARSSLPPEVVQGFDAALKTQIPHLAWLANVVPGGAALAVKSAAGAAVKAAAPAPMATVTLDPPKSPAAASAAAPTSTLDPPKRAATPTQTLAPPQKPTAPVFHSSAPAVQTSAVAPGAFVYAPYPKMGALNEAPGASSEVRSPTSTSTEVRSPTSTSTEVRSPTSTSTEAYTQGNMTVTVTGGAGAGETNVVIEAPPLNRENTARSRGAPKNAHENVNINAPRPSGPTAQENKSVNASGLGGPPPDCLSLGPPITDMSGGMRHAGLSAVNGSRGRSRMVAGPDGKDYLFALEGGTLIARQCFSEPGALNGPGFAYAPYALNAPPPPHGGRDGGHAHGEHHFSHGGGNRGGHSGWGGRGFPWNYVTTVQTCRTWGDPIMMISEMATAAQTALNASGGRPTTVRGPDGVLYLFAIENGAYTARTCAAVV